MTKGFSGEVLAFLMAVLLPALAYAQNAQPAPDVSTGTPPELRDFRLDQPPPRPEPEQPAPQPQQPEVSPPPLAPTVEPQQRNQPREAIRRERVPTRPSGVADANPPDLDQTAAPEAADEARPAEVPLVVEQAPARQQAAPPADLAIWAWIGGGVALLASLIALAWFWRRRRGEIQPQGKVRDALAEQPSPPARLEKSSLPALPVGDRPEPADRRSDGKGLMVQFAPSSAQLSIASLTVTGRLTVENRSSATATELALRSQMISAQDGQREAVDAFHANKGDGEIQPLGDLAAGERIDAIVEIRLPRTELHAFRWSEREFVAPIVLINVAGLSDGQPVEARLSQLIGREGAEPSARMKPLAIDRGPKRFDGVGARPAFA